MKFGFYLLGEKGLAVLKSFLDRFDAGAVRFVVVGQDANLEDDRSNALRRLCDTHAVPVFDRGAGSDLPSVDCSFAIGWRWMVRETAGLIVLHDSLLPRYRGFAPLVNMLINGEEEIGVTALFAADEYDRGDIIAQRSERIAYPIMIQQAIDALLPLYAGLVTDLAGRLLDGEALPRHPQEEADATYSMWRNELDYAIDWRQSAEEINRFVDAVGSPYAGAAAFAGERRVRIRRVSVVRDVTVERRNQHLGKILFMPEGKPIVVCGVGLVRINDAAFDDTGESLLGRIPFRTAFSAQPTT